MELTQGSPPIQGSSKKLQISSVCGWTAFYTHTWLIKFHFVCPAVTSLTIYLLYYMRLRRLPHFFVKCETPQNSVICDASVNVRIMVEVRMLDRWNQMKIACKSWHLKFSICLGLSERICSIFYKPSWMIRQNSWAFRRKLQLDLSNIIQNEQKAMISDSELRLKIIEWEVKLTEELEWLP